MTKIEFSDQNQMHSIFYVLNQIEHKRKYQKNALRFIGDPNEKNYKKEHIHKRFHLVIRRQNKTYVITEKYSHKPGASFPCLIPPRNGFRFLIRASFLCLYLTAITLATVYFWKSPITKKD